MAFVRLSNMPSPPQTRVSNVQTPIGGLNLRDIAWQVEADQSSDLRNMWWEEGALRSRPEQETHNNGMVRSIDSQGFVESVVASHAHLYNGWYVMHWGDGLYALSEDCEVYHRLSEQGGSTPFKIGASAGTFFLFGGVLYYKNRGAFVAITETRTGVDGYDLRELCAASVVPFVPTILVNADPTVRGAGDLYQPVNRMTAQRKVTFSVPARVAEVVLPEYAETEGIKVEYLSSAGDWIEVNYSEVTSATETKTVTIKFGEGLTQITEDGQNNLRVTYSVVDEEDFYGKLMDCDIAEVYGGTQGLCVVMAGCTAQANAYFWSGNTNVGMDIGYFPVEHYNLADDASNPITAFGKQQNLLVIFQQRCVGRSTLGTAEIDGRTFITMNYETINPYIGCDLPKSVQLVENNLVFANSRRGVMVIKDTSSAHENNILNLSRNIEAPVTAKGLLHDLQSNPNDVCSIDDGRRYWLYANRHVWLWDYSLSTTLADARKQAWFLFDGINPGAWFGQNEGHVCYLGRDGYLRLFRQIASETMWPDGVNWKTRSEDFERLVALRIQDFGTYEVLKDVDKAIFVVQGVGNARIDIEYETDYEVRMDQTPILTRGWALVPRDLAFRSLRTFPFAVTSVRKPGCRHVRHFLVRLRNKTRGVKMTFISAQIYYTFQGVDR